MQSKMAQLMIQEVVDGKDADDVLKASVEGEVERDVEEEKPETPSEGARRFIENKADSSQQEPR